MKKKVKAWVTKDKNEFMYRIHFEKPKKCIDVGMWFPKDVLQPNYAMLIPINDSVLKDITTWEDKEPLEIEITIKKK